MDTLGSVNDFAEQQLQVLTKHVGFRRVLLVSGGVMGILVLAAVAMRHVSRWSLLACLAAQVVVLVAYSVPPRGIGRALWHFMLSRLSSSRLFARCEVGGTTSQLRLVVLRFGVAEANLALSLVFFPALPLLERVVQTTVLVSAAFFAVPAAGGYRPIMYAISIPLFVLAILWATVPLPDAASVSLADPAVWGTELGLLLGWLMMYVATEATRRVPNWSGRSAYRSNSPRLPTAPRHVSSPPPATTCANPSIRSACSPRRWRCGRSIHAAVKLPGASITRCRICRWNSTRCSISRNSMPGQCVPN
jgi:hypothetical protein